MSSTMRVREDQLAQLFGDWLTGRTLAGPGSKELIATFMAIADKFGPFEGVVDPADEDLRRRLRHVAAKLHSLPLNWCISATPPGPGA